MQGSWSVAVDEKCPSLEMDNAVLVGAPAWWRTVAMDGAEDDDDGLGALHRALSLHRRHRPLCRGYSHDLLFHHNGTYPPMHPSTIADLLQRHRQPLHPDAYTAPQERWYFISPQLFDLNQKIDRNLVTLLSFQLLEFSS